MTKVSFVLVFVLAISALLLTAAKGGVRGTGLVAVEEQARNLATYRIVGGTGTSFRDHPFFVDLDGCGASLIWEDCVLTAAHCNVGISSARVGPSQQSVSVTSGTVHPNYDARTSNFDIMVLKLESTVSDASTIGLESNSGIPSNGDDLVVIGLGLTSEGGSPSDGLLEATVDYIPNERCNQMYDNSITSAMLCAGVIGGGKDSCQGDSGGPIIKGNKQVGVVSFGDGCARPNKPGVYARASAGYDWIQRMICCHSANPPSNCGTIDPSECPNNLGAGGGGGDDDSASDDFGFQDDDGGNGQDDDGNTQDDDRPNTPSPTPSIDDDFTDDNNPTDDVTDDGMNGDDFIFSPTPGPDRPQTPFPTPEFANDDFTDDGMNGDDFIFSPTPGPDRPQTPFPTSDFGTDDNAGDDQWNQNDQPNDQWDDDWDGNDDWNWGDDFSGWDDNFMRHR